MNYPEVIGLVMCHSGREGKDIDDRRCIMVDHSADNTAVAESVRRVHGGGFSFLFDAIRLVFRMLILAF